MINIKSCTVTDTEAMDRVVLDVDIVDRAVAKDFTEFDEVIRPNNVVRTEVTAKAQSELI